MNFQDQLKALSKQAKAQAAAQKVAEQEAKRQATEEVNFSQIMADVQPIKNSRRYEHPVNRTPIKPRDKHQDSLNDDGFFYVADTASWQEIPATFSKNGQGVNDIKRLQAGHWEVVADVDLHGYTQEEAQRVLNEFIEFLQQRGVCGEIVHGSGLSSSGYTPVLKGMVRRWLMQHPDVLAYAEPRKNNDGAVRILVKRRRKKDLWAEE